MPHVGLCSISRILKRLPESHVFWFNVIQRNSSQGESPGRLMDYFNNEKESVEEINEKFALPYVNVHDLCHNLPRVTDSRASTSCLMKSSYNGQLHRPAIPMSYIMSNIDEIEKNLCNRKIGVKIDLKKDIIGAYQRMATVQLEKDKTCRLKESLAESMKNFWINHNRSTEKVPPEIEKKRVEAIALSCKISILSWIHQQLETMFYEKALLLPNLTHPKSPVGDESAAEIMNVIGDKPEVEASIGHMDVGEASSTIRQSNLVNISGLRTYYLSNSGAELEQALVRYALDILKRNGFHLMSCPNILHGSVFEGCGIPGSKLSEMLYHIDPSQEKDFYVSGTSEVGIAGFFANHAISVKHLPLKICCVSTCNRKETDRALESRGLYRVHHFTKVEMFGITANETGTESEELFQEILDIQKHIFSSLGLHFRILNMPTEELALPAYQKVDMEAWMSHRKCFGEISSTSNCTDFQSRRLHILYKIGNEYKFAHTVNGTACAVPRVMIAIYENNQKEKSVHVPDTLSDYMNESNINRKSRLVMEYIGPNQSKKKQKVPAE